MRGKKPLIIFWLIISVAVVLILAIIGGWGYFLEKKFPMNNPEAATGEFVEAKWMNGMDLAEIYHQWKSEGRHWFEIEPVKPGTQGLIVEKFKTEKKEDALLYCLCRATEMEMDYTETVAVEIFSSSLKSKYAIYRDERKWEEVEFFEVNLGTTLSGPPWLFVSFRYKPVAKKNILIPFQKKRERQMNEGNGRFRITK